MGCGGGKAYHFTGKVVAGFGPKTDHPQICQSFPEQSVGLLSKTREYNSKSWWFLLGVFPAQDSESGRLPYFCSLRKETKPKAIKVKLSEILKCHWSSLESTYSFLFLFQTLLSRVRQNSVADSGVKFKFLPYPLFHSIHLQLWLAGWRKMMFAMSLRGYKWNKLSEWAQVEPTGLYKSELEEKPNKIKKTVEAPKLWNHLSEVWKMPHHWGAQTRSNTAVDCGDLLEPGQCSQSLGCLCSHAGIQKSWCSVFRALEIPGVLVEGAQQEEGASLGGEIGQHSWGGWPSSGEWGWVSFCTTSSLCINTQCLKSGIYPHTGSKKVDFPNISQEQENQQLLLLQKGLWPGL